MTDPAFAPGFSFGGHSSRANLGVEEIMLNYSLTIMVNNGGTDISGAASLSSLGDWTMKQIFRLSAACVALVAGPAFAADYDPPIYIEEAPEFVPVEIGSGWYLRGDISYNSGRPVYKSKQHNVSNRRFGGGAGVGYHFTDNFRGDITLNYLGSDYIDYNPGPGYAKGSYKAWSGLVSGYYDIATIVGITPYVGAGLGVVHSRYDVDTENILDKEPALPNRGYNFAYALMAGASYKVTDNVSVDLGYQFLHAPDAKRMNLETTNIHKGTKHHQIKLGLRYDIW